MKKYIDSKDPQERLIAAKVILKTRLRLFSKQIMKLCNDSDKTVSLHALRAACKMQIDTVVPKVINLLSDRENRAYMIRNLIAFNSDLIPKVEGLIREHQIDFQKFKGVILALIKMNEPKVNHFLFQIAQEVNIRRRDYILSKLLRNNYKVTRDHKSVVNGCIQREIKRLHLMSAAKLAISEEKKAEPIVIGLTDSIHSTMRRLLTYITFKHENLDREFLTKNYYSENSSQVALAVEYLDYQLENKIREIFLPLVDAEYDEKKIKAILDKQFGEISYTLDEALKAIIEAGREINLWTRSTTLRYIGQAKLQRFKALIIQEMQAKVWILRQSAAWALNELDRETFKKELKLIENDPNKKVREFVKKLAS